MAGGGPVIAVRYFSFGGLLTSRMILRNFRFLVPVDSRAQEIVSVLLHLLGGNVSLRVIERTKISCFTYGLGYGYPPVETCGTGKVKKKRDAPPLMADLPNYGCVCLNSQRRCVTYSWMFDSIQENGEAATQAEARAYNCVGVVRLPKRTIDLTRRPFSEEGIGLSEEKPPAVPILEEINVLEGDDEARVPFGKRFDLAGWAATKLHQKHTYVGACLENCEERRREVEILDA
ncbi:hypothetical protein C8R43DRAFT_941257 [Mycena crocata]|nr:hypothetical protein C8R43DRAFT_941257 [Mycena crocata]